MKPSILLTPRGDEIHSSPIYCENQAYFDMITKAGGLPMLCGIVSQEDAAAFAEMFDGLLITGGGDVNPLLYHEHYDEPDDPFIIFDQNDILLYYAFVKAGKPVLGICRGLQVIGVAEGAKLIRDLPTAGYDNHNQKHFEPPLGMHDFAHDDAFMPDTRLHHIFGDAYPVNSFHHQALQSVPNGFTLAALSQKDHVIEAMEKENVLAVQWHPERLMADEKHFQLAKQFIDDCLLCKTR